MGMLGRLIPGLVLTCCLLSGCGSGLAPVVQNRQLLTFGGMGDDPGKFREPRQITLTPRGTLLIGDFRNYRFQELSLSGQPLNVWGRRGDQPGQFLDPTSAAMDSQGNVYAVDTWNHRIQKFSSDNGTWNAEWATADFYAPRGIAIDASDRIYVVNTSRHSIVVFDTEGKRLAIWGDGTAGVDGFHDPIGIAVGRDGNVYIADPGNARVKVMSPEGKVVRIIHIDDWARDEFIEGYIALDSKGSFYITSPYNNKIVGYTPDGQMFTRFGAYGSGPEQMNTPTGIAVTDDDRIVISDSMNHRIVIYAPPPPIPDFNKEENRHESLISIIRWIIDGIALVIILPWLLIRLKKFFRRFSFLSRLFAHPTMKRWSFIVGCSIAVLSMFLLRLTSFTLAGGSALLFALIALTIGVASPVSNQLPGASVMSRRTRGILIVLFLILAVFLRFHRLQEVPAGINNDAAWNGTYALRILDGEPYQPFTDEAWGKETFYMYLIAGSFGIFGVSIYSLYLPCILAGLLTVIALYYFCRDLWNNNVAVICSAIYAVLAWNLTYSRTGYRAILAPLFLILSSMFFFRAVDAPNWRRRLLYYAGTGLAIGAGLHTYFSFRSVPLMMIAVGIHAWITTPRFFRRNWWGPPVLIAIASTVVLPLALYAIHHPDIFLSRTNFLFVGNQVKSAGSLKPLWNNLVGVTQIFHYAAKVGNFFEPTYPIVSATVGFFMIPGLAYAIRFVRRRDGFWLISAMIFSLLPGYLSLPDATRIIMMTVPLAIFTGIGIHLFITFMMEHCFLSRIKNLSGYLISLILILITLTEYHLLFYVQAKSHHARFGYAPSHTALGRKAVELSADHHILRQQQPFSRHTQIPVP